MGKKTEEEIRRIEEEKRRHEEERKRQEEEERKKLQKLQKRWHRRFLKQIKMQEGFTVHLNLKGQRVGVVISLGLSIHARRIVLNPGMEGIG